MAIRVPVIALLPNHHYMLHRKNPSLSSSSKFFRHSWPFLWKLFFFHLPDTQGHLFTSPFSPFSHYFIIKLFLALHVFQDCLSSRGKLIHWFMNDKSTEYKSLIVFSLIWNMFAKPIPNATKTERIWLERKQKQCKGQRTGREAVKWQWMCMYCGRE